MNDRRSVGPEESPENARVYVVVDGSEEISAVRRRRFLDGVA